MPMNINAVKNMNVDPKMVQEIASNGSMVAEQGGAQNFMAEYGGSANYIAFAKMPENDRLVYASLLDGYTQPDQISVATGLSQAEVNTSIGKLGRQGVIDAPAEPGGQVLAME